MLVGPDNGLLAPAVAIIGGAERAVELTNPQYQLEAPGATFAGRDVFAPAAAHLANGVPIEAFGPALDPAPLLAAVMWGTFVSPKASRPTVDPLRLLLELAVLMRVFVGQHKLGTVCIAPQDVILDPAREDGAAAGAARLG